MPKVDTFISDRNIMYLPEGTRWADGLWHTSDRCLTGMYDLEILARK